MHPQVDTQRLTTQQWPVHYVRNRSQLVLCRGEIVQLKGNLSTHLLSLRGLHYFLQAPGGATFVLPAKGRRFCLLPDVQHQDGMCLSLDDGFVMLYFTGPFNTNFLEMSQKCFGKF